MNSTPPHLPVQEREQGRREALGEVLEILSWELQAVENTAEAALIQRLLLATESLLLRRQSSSA